MTFVLQVLSQTTFTILYRQGRYIWSCSGSGSDTGTGMGKLRLLSEYHVLPSTVNSSKVTMVISISA